MSDVQNWPALADAVNRRREELGWSRGGFTLISDDTAVYMIEWNRRTGLGARVLPIEHELRWRPGLALEVLAGTVTEEEIMLAGSGAKAPRRDLGARIRESHEEVRRRAEIRREENEAAVKEATDRIEGIEREIAADPRLDAEAVYRLRLQVERYRCHILFPLLGIERNAR